MPDVNNLLWFFFRFSGRVNRSAYVLGFLLLGVVASFPLYQFMRFEGMPGADGWAVLFSASLIISIWGHLAISVKRLHDLDKPGLFAIALAIPVISIIAFVALCVLPGAPGPNGYGATTNSPR